MPTYVVAELREIPTDQCGDVRYRGDRQASFRKPVVTGRTVELDDLAALLDDPRIRLLTLTGGAGVGKSSLARASLESRTPRVDESVLPVVSVDLGSATTPDSAWEKIVARLHETSLELSRILSPDRGGPFEQVRQSARACAVLLLLDNCDLVTRGMARDIGELLDSCPRLRIVATSRTPLNLRSECVYCVGPISVSRVDGNTSDEDRSPAAGLLLDSIGSHYRQGLGVIADRAVLERIAASVDGVPLALELAAASIERVGPAQTLRMIESETDLTSDRFDDTPLRHRSLCAAVEWALGDLDPSALELLLQLSCHDGVIGRSAALLAARSDIDAGTSAIAELVNRSLLHYCRDEEGKGTYYFLAPVRRWCRLAVRSDPARESRIRSRHVSLTAVSGAELGTWVQQPVAAHRMGSTDLGASTPPEREQESPLSRLTPRQFEIAEFVATGMTNRMIANRLGLSEWTIVNHLRQVMTKLDCPSRVHVALMIERWTANERAGQEPGRVSC